MCGVCDGKEAARGWFSSSLIASRWATLLVSRPLARPGLRYCAQAELRGALSEMVRFYGDLLLGPCYS